MARIKHTFSKEQQEILRANIYTRKVTENSISFTLAFKQLALEETRKPGMSFRKFLKQAGYDPEMLGDSRVYSSLGKIRKEAASKRGLHEIGPSIESIAARNLEKERTKTAIRDLQEHVDKLEQEVAFLKKISLHQNIP